MELMERQARTLTRLVDDLLDTARISRGQVQLRRETVALQPPRPGEQRRAREGERVFRLSAARLLAGSLLVIVFPGREKIDQ
jgi:signal transduction histidine kinase